MLHTPRQDFSITFLFERLSFLPQICYIAFKEVLSKNLADDGLYHGCIKLMLPRAFMGCPVTALLRHSHCLVMCTSTLILLGMPSLSFYITDAIIPKTKFLQMVCK